MKIIDTRLDINNLHAAVEYEKLTLAKSELITCRKIDNLKEVLVKQTFYDHLTMQLVAYVRRSKNSNAQIHSNLFLLP